MFSLQGKTALITGASQGLGFEIAKSYAESGAKIILHGRDKAKLTNAQASLKTQEYTSQTAICDFNNSKDIETFLNTLPTIDILVNNVGIRNRQNLDDFSQTDIEDMLQTNLIAPFQVARHVAKHMKEQKYGKIINITSIAAQISRAGDAAYVASKGGLESLTRALAAELGPHNINVNGIAPGFFATNTNTDMVKDTKITEWLDKRTSLGRWGTPSEITGTAVFLASPAASYITGQIFNVDGGYTAHF